MSAAARPATALLLAALTAACGAIDDDGPPELRLGVDECSRCRMIVSEAATAAVARGPAGEEARFDDLACLAAFVDGAEQAADWRIWVRTLDQDRWLDARRAHFLRHPQRITPMGSGLVAYREPPREPPAALTDWTELIRSAKEDLSDERR